jgi:hypothetical protein
MFGGLDENVFDKNSVEFLEIDPAFIAGERPEGQMTSRSFVSPSPLTSIKAIYQ